jgi:ankyrin repeat protein
LKEVINSEDDTPATNAADIPQIDEQRTVDQEAFFRAVKDGDVNTVKLALFQNNIDINLSSTSEDSEVPPLFLAVENKQEEVAKLLLERDDLEVNFQDSKGQTALILACRNKMESLANNLLARGDIQVNLKDSSNKTELEVASDEKLNETMKLLLERDDIQIKDDFEHWDYMLETVCKFYGDEKLARRLIARDDFPVNLQNDFGRTLLHSACRAELSMLAKLLLERKDIQVNIQDIFSTTALWPAGGSKLKEILKLLLERQDIQVNIQDSNGETALHWALKIGGRRALSFC